MVKRVGIAALICLLCAGLAKAQSPDPQQVPRVAVLPFAAHTATPRPQLGLNVQELLAQQLVAEGMDVVPLPETRKVSGQTGMGDEAKALQAARRLQADFVLFGSLSQLGQKASLDAKLLDVSGQRKPQVLFAEGVLEDLTGAAQDLAQQVAVRLLAKAVIADVRVRGNERIEADAILVNVESRKGDLLREHTIQKDIRSIFKMGYFETVAADVTDSDKGKIITFVVREKPTVVDVKVEGNDDIDEKNILAAIATKPFTVLQKSVVTEDVNRIIKLYHQKAYFNAKVTPDIQFPRDPRKAVVTFRIQEGRKLYTKKIQFTGNKHFSDRKLRGVMETKQRGFFSWFSDKGVLDREVLETDLDRVTAFYHDHGYMDARVGTPQIEKREDGFYVTIPVVEGERYTIASVDVQGDLLETTPKVKEEFELKKGDHFSREKLRKDLDRLTKHYMDQGYAYVEVNPGIKRDPATHRADIVYNVRKGPLVHIERITIAGNTKTRDKVIRRQLRLAEGDRFSSSALERSNLNLKKIDYFEDVEIQPSEGSTSDAMNLHIKVKEKPTGAISVGGGFSSDDGLFVGGDIVQRNLFGRGQYAAIKAYLGGETSRYSISFTEPWLFDTPLSAGFDIYNWYREYTDFNKDAIGGKIRFSHPFGNWSRWYLSYVFENAKVSDVDEDASLIIKDQEGRQIKSSLIASVERDSTDDRFLPTRGSTHSLTVEYSIPYLGSDSDFVSVVANTGWYIPLWWKFIGFVHGKAGYIFELDKEKKPVPIYERFFLGGINSIRAFDWGEVGPKDPDTGDEIGGLKFGLVNLELLFPLVEKIGMRGVVFFDAGNAFDRDENFSVSDFRTAAGAGIRWKSPMGPLRIEWGYNLDPEPGESTSKWQFSMGVSF
ncbi:Beta-barrel assembly machine subunit BamA [Desulfacinum hydrothermale DSM 13146]|uniref:Outer membrane protein assembly factor BamA n=1 Tax=Desulfacinum hydrothermale DSM 13146 TaxID=1121390 RepID=A0A1W1XW91_9BACT|nr:outer membrane protein assembly factor BamA [Desulfacinum hydrothermale]SMC27811.1 Beta-barrel assembly machine subunit BamA [Desulfacinum hydrothermale DSM 13146]